MSQNGHAQLLTPPPMSTTMIFGAGDLPSGHWFEMHEHPQHQIAWASRGVLAVQIGVGRWVLPPTRALWIPGGIAHRTGTSHGAAMRGIFVEPEHTPVAFTAPTLLRVGRLLHELFDHLASDDADAANDRPDARRDRGDAGPRRRAEAVVFDLLDPVEVVPVGAPMPTDPRALTVARALVRDPADDRALHQFAATAAASPRTLARLFLAETGMTFGQWRTQIRLAASLPLLAGGLPVTRIAERVGYGTSSAYVAAFHRMVGISPGRYFAR
ncbi:AraC family transcriptional regulator [Nocardia jiangxiensis]|uniref:AraC family transcriptional regulator n=1 Tax=Nocardia jiangxiensis TaxID=282685 RepID=UPI001FE1E8FD|nr:helix-turn-helix transcriptional regulator [Nocardia jiangxiensis]